MRMPHIATYEYVACNTSQCFQKALAAGSSFQWFAFFCAFDTSKTLSFQCFLFFSSGHDCSCIPRGRPGLFRCDSVDSQWDKTDKTYNVLDSNVRSSVAFFRRKNIQGIDMIFFNQICSASDTDILDHVFAAGTVSLTSHTRPRTSKR